MSGGVLYVPLRDSSGLRSVCLNEREFVIGQCGSSSSLLRVDGREMGETRPMRMQLNRQFCQSECSVSLGACTKVSCSVKCELVPPASPISRPNEGMWIFRVDLSPMACLGWEYTSSSTTDNNNNSSSSSHSMNHSMAGEESQRWWSNRILRTLERTLVNGGAVDAEALCVQSGRWVWRLNVEVVVMDAGGNLVDACVLAAISALRHFRAPAVDVMTNDYTIPPKLWHPSEREPTPLPIHHSPLSTSFALFRSNKSSTVAALVDPTWREEMIMDGLLTAAFNQHGEMCGLDFAGGCELRPSQLTACVELAKQKCTDLCQQMETALEQAQQQAQQQLLNQLQKTQPQPQPPLNPNIPFLQTTSNNNNNNIINPIDTNDMDQITDAAAKLAAQQQEQYRLQALEYSQLHQAAKVKENKTNHNNNQKINNNNNKNSLMAAMLQSASSITNVTPPHTDNSNKHGTKISSKTADTPSSKTNSPKDESQMDNINTVSKDNNHSATTSSVDNQKTVLQKDTIVNNQMDYSDDEEITTTLKSEFQSIQRPTTTEKVTSSITRPNLKPHDVVMKTQDDNSYDDNEVDDLAMAVKKKKKSKKSKSKKK